MITVGLVAEGPHDFIMLAPLIRAEFKKKSSEELSFRKLQPQVDATGATTEGGWGRVVGWCQRYAGNQLSTFFEPLFSDELPCDAVIVHMDGDALEMISKHLGVQISTGTISIGDRVDMIVKILEDIIALNSEQRKGLAFAIPVQHTEAWMLSASPKHQGDFSNKEAKKIFRNQYDFRKKKKLKQYYEEKTVECTNNGELPSCVSYKKFQDEVNALSPRNAPSADEGT